MVPTPQLSAEELRVLACLVEKANTTPDHYPLSTNALTTACNQKTSRDPIVEYSAALVDQTMQLLRDGGWARSIRGSGNRAFKHRHVIDERLGLDGPAQAVWAVLALRGPQSPGELKTRTERYHPFETLTEVEAVLDRLAGRDVPLVANVGRQSGQSQDRWVELLGPHGSAGPDRSAGTIAAVPAAGSSGHLDHRPEGWNGPDPVVDGAATDASGVGPSELERRLTLVEERLSALERELGLDPG